jgi:hypothetical protein
MSIPLGWALSPAVRNEMDLQITGKSCPPFENRENLTKIEDILKARFRETGK